MHCHTYRASAGAEVLYCTAVIEKQGNSVSISTVLRFKSTFIIFSNDKGVLFPSTSSFILKVTYEWSIACWRSFHFNTHIWDILLNLSWLWGDVFLEKRITSLVVCSTSSWDESRCWEHTVDALFILQSSFCPWQTENKEYCFLFLKLDTTVVLFTHTGQHTSIYSILYHHSLLLP